MKSSRLAPLLGFAALLTALVTGFVVVLEKRFASGDIYPHYSTLRSDPLGSRALFESLAALPELEVSRNRRDLMAIDSLDGDTTLWLCGLSRAAFNRLRAPEDSPVLRAVETRGARLVITINPQLVPEKYELKQGDDWLERRERIRKQRSGENAGDAGEETIPDDTEAAPPDPLPERLEAALESPSAFERPDGGWEPERGDAVAPETLPAELPRWHSQFRFTDLGGAWRVIASIDGAPVVIERPWGAGTVVLTSDSYFASNEALWTGANPEFLLWLAGDKRRVIFDETIHGTVESGGVMKMIRRYRFHGFLYGLLILVVLLAWKSGTSLAPGSEALERGLVDDGDGGDSVAGEETSAGLIRLLRHNVPPGRLLRTCLDTWRQTAGRGLRSESRGQAEAIDSLVAAHESAPKEVTVLQAYGEIARILAHPDDFRRENRP